MAFIFSEAKSTSHSFNATTGIKLGGKVTAKCGVPLIVEGSIEVSSKLAVGLSATSTNTITKTFAANFPI